LFIPYTHSHQYQLLSLYNIVQAAGAHRVVEFHPSLSFQTNQQQYEQHAGDKAEAQPEQ